MLPVGGRLAAISFHSLEDRRVKRFLAERARGCVCPPELPVCVCGREPEAELLTRRAVAPGPEEVAANPRSQLRPPARRGRRSPPRPPGGRLMAGRGARPQGGAAARAPAPQTSAPGRRARAAAAPARAPAARPSQPAGAGGQLIPIAVGTAAAVRHLPDSGLVVRMTRGRAWIGVLGVLLAGIVALNVVTLSLAAPPATSTRTSRPSNRRTRSCAAATRSAPARRGSATTRPALGLGDARRPTRSATIAGRARDDVADAAQRLAAAGTGY